jgi:hypothetical protein
MNPKSPGSCALQVELLEGRLLLDAANPVAIGQGAPRPDSPPLDHAAVVSLAPHTTNYDEDDGGKAPTTPLLVSDAGSAPGQRVLLINAAGPIRDLNDRDRERNYELPGDRQLPSDDSRDKRARNQIASVSADPPTADSHLPATFAGSQALLRAKPPTIPDPPELLGASSGRLLGIADFASEAMLPPFERDPVSQLAHSAPPTTNAEATLGTTTSLLPDLSIPEGWREVLLDPFVGIPVRDVVSLNLSTLGAEADEFLSHIVNLEPGWGSDLELSEYVWLAGGILLAGGGIYFARAARSSRVVTDPRLRPPMREEDQ